MKKLFNEKKSSVFISGMLFGVAVFLIFKGDYTPGVMAIVSCMMFNFLETRRDIISGQQRSM